MVEPSHRSLLDKPGYAELLLVVLTIVCFIPVFSCGFIEGYDDELYVTLNPMVNRGLTWAGLRWSWSAVTGGNWNPLTWWSHMLDVTLFGLRPAGHHAVSLLIHALNVQLLYRLLLRMGGSRSAALLVALLFAVHPLRVESVAWVAERKDVLSVLAGLAAVHAYFSYTVTRQWRQYAGLCVWFVASLMAKPMLVTLPLLLLLCDWWPLGRLRVERPARLLLEKLPLLLPVVAVSVLTIVAQRREGALISLAEQSWLQRSAQAVDASVVYLRKFFYPLDLASYYPLATLPWWRTALEVALLGVLSVLAWQQRRQRPWLLFGWLWYGVTLMPVIGLIKVGSQAYADRYTYLPLLGVTLALLWGVGMQEVGVLRRRWLAGFAGGALLICALLTWRQCGYWRDGFVLYNRELQVSPTSWHGHNGLATLLVKRGQIDEGIGHYRIMLANNRYSLAARRGLGMAYAAQGDVTRARSYLLSAIAQRPDDDHDYLELAALYVNSGDRRSALAVLRDGLRQVPHSSRLAEEEATLARALAAMGALP